MGLNFLRIFKDWSPKSHSPSPWQLYPTNVRSCQVPTHSKLREKRKHLHTLFIPLSSLRITTFFAPLNVGQLRRSKATRSMRERAHEKFIKPFKRGQVTVDINNGGRAELSSNLRGAQQQQWHSSIWPPFVRKGLPSGWVSVSSAQPRRDRGGETRNMSVGQWAGNVWVCTVNVCILCFCHMIRSCFSMLGGLNIRGAGGLVLALMWYHVCVCVACFSLSDCDVCVCLS